MDLTLLQKGLDRKNTAAAAFLSKAQQGKAAETLQTRGMEKHLSAESITFQSNSDFPWFTRDFIAALSLQRNLLSCLVLLFLRL